MKIAIAQINTTVGDFYGNVELIKNNAIKAVAHGAEIVVFPCYHRIEHRHPQEI